MSADRDGEFLSPPSEAFRAIRLCDGLQQPATHRAPDNYAALDVRNDARHTSVSAKVGLLAVGTALVAMVFMMDALIATANLTALETGIADEPAHIASYALLLATAMAWGLAPSVTFMVAALISSVAIDIDHIPAYLGWNALTHGVPRPITHGLLVLGALSAIALIARGRVRNAFAGLAAGCAAHLLRDVATAGGLAPLQPFNDTTVHLPYPLYGLLLISMLGIMAKIPSRLLATRMRKLFKRFKYDRKGYLPSTLS